MRLFYVVLASGTKLVMTRASNNALAAIIQTRTDLRAIDIADDERVLTVQLDLIFARLESGLPAGAESLRNFLLAARQLPRLEQQEEAVVP